MFFLWFWGRPGRSMGWAHMQSAHACAVETHFFVFACFLKIGSTLPHSDSILEPLFVNNHNFEWKKSSKKWFKKRWPPWLKQVPMTLARRSLAAPLACSKDFWTRNNCLSKKQQQLLQWSDTLWAKARRISPSQKIKIKIIYNEKFTPKERV